jgi:hypothetical protein
VIHWKVSVGPAWFRTLAISELDEGIGSKLNSLPFWLPSVLADKTWCVIASPDWVKVLTIVMEKVC